MMKIDSGLLFGPPCMWLLQTIQQYAH